MFECVVLPCHLSMERCRTAPMSGLYYSTCTRYLQYFSTRSRCACCSVSDQAKNQVLCFWLAKPPCTKHDNESKDSYLIVLVVAEHLLFSILKTSLPATNTFRDILHHALFRRFVIIGVSPAHNTSNCNRNIRLGAQICRWRHAGGRHACFLRDHGQI